MYVEYSVTHAAVGVRHLVEELELLNNILRIAVLVTIV